MVGESITRIQHEIDCFSAGLMEDQEYMESPVDEEGHELLSNLGPWMAERVVEEQQTHFKASEKIIKQYISGWDSRLMKHKWEVLSVVNGPFVLTKHLKAFLASLKRVNSDNVV